MDTTFQRWTAAVAAVLILTGATPLIVAQGTSDAKALEVADHMMDALGGQENWARQRTLHAAPSTAPCTLSGYTVYFPSLSPYVPPPKLSAPGSPLLLLD